MNIRFKKIYDSGQCLKCHNSVSDKASSSATFIFSSKVPLSSAQFDDHAIESLKAEVGQALNHAFRIEMKEIKGLEERLYGLEQLMVETKKIVQEQSDLTQVHFIFQIQHQGVFDTTFFSAKSNVKVACVYLGLLQNSLRCRHVPSYRTNIVEFVSCKHLLVMIFMFSR